MGAGIFFLTPAGQVADDEGVMNVAEKPRSAVRAAPTGTRLYGDVHHTGSAALFLKGV